MSDALEVRGLRSLSGSLDIETSAEDAFALLAEVEKWPVWLSFLRSARLVDPKRPLALGSEVVLRSSIPGEEEQLYEVDGLIGNYHLSLVGAYSVRRRIDFRIERKTSRAKVHVKLTYPAYHGRLGAWVDQLRHGRKLNAALNHSLVLFRGMVEYHREPDACLAEL
ncbi:MAG TPA: hypothetical protein VIG46_06425 [Candidatus Baltobacteraceae bacterium]